MTLIEDLPAADTEEAAARLSRTERRRKRTKPVTPVEETGQRVLTPQNARGTKLRTRKQLGQRQFYAPAVPGAPTTSRQAEILNTAVVAAPTVLDAPLLGIDTLSDAPIYHDPFDAYQANLLSSPNAILIGDVGSSKSSCVKTVYVLRPLIRKDRRVVVIDKKLRSTAHSEGEYAELTRAFGSEPIMFSTSDSGMKLNLMDPLITGTANAGKDQIRLLRTIAELAQDGDPLSQWESEALRAAYRGSMKRAQDRGRTPVLTDVVACLGRPDLDPTGVYEDLNSTARDRLHEAGFGVKFLFNGLLEEYSGVFDGETSSAIRLSDKLTSFDVSQLPEDGPLISMVISMVNMWVLGSLKGEGSMRTNFVIDEGWHVMNGPVAKLMRSNTKLARALGLAMVTAFHKLADVPVDSPAMSLIQEAQTIHLMHQERKMDVDRCIRDFNLDPASAEIIQQLKKGFHIFKRGSEAELLIHHLRSDLEVQLTDTDASMIGAA